MGLVDLASVAPLLACPGCRSSLVEEAAGFRCSSSACRFSTPGAFPAVGPCPVIVDFERTVLRPEDLRSPSGTGRPSRQRAGSWSIDRLPPRLRPWWKPPNRVAAGNVERLLALLPDPSPLVLVVGGATMGNGVESLYADRRARVLGFDICGSPLTQFIADAHRIPLASGTVDAVLVQAVLEHVLDPAEVVAEIHRVLRDGGLVYAETPFLQQVHAGPYDFSRFTSSGHRYLFRAFEEIAAGPVAGPGTQLLWSVDHLVRGLLRSQLAGKLARALFSWLRLLDRLIPTAYALDGASACYFLGRRANRELTPREIIGYYRGAQGAAEPADAA
jgi:SAM-dependent methyltransferase